MIDHRMCLYIKTIEKCRNFSKASKELYVAQPSLSRYVHSLEKKLGVKLFNRKKIPLELTKAGERFIDYIYEFEKLEKKMETEFLLMSTGTSDHMTIGTLPYLGEYIIPQIIPTFRQQNPNLVLDIKEYNGKSIEEALINGDIDLFLTNLAPKNRKIDYYTVAKDRMLLVTLRTPSLEQRYNLSSNSINNPNCIDLIDFSNETFILLNTWQNMRIMTDEIFKSCDFNPHSILQTSSVASSLNLVNCGRGYTFVCESALQYAKVNVPLAYFLVDCTKNNASIIIAYMKREKESIIYNFCNCATSILSI